MSDVGYQMSDTARIRSHRDLIVWQKAMDLVVSVYRESDTFPKTEIYGLTSQVRRAVVSIPANIAEGQGRRLTGEYIQFLGNARGSLLEVDTHIEIALRLGLHDYHGSFSAGGATSRSEETFEWLDEITGKQVLVP